MTDAKSLEELIEEGKAKKIETIQHGKIGANIIRKIEKYREGGRNIKLHVYDEYTEVYEIEEDEDP